MNYLNNAIMEITTNIDCPVQCSFCPQSSLTKNFKLKGKLENYSKERILNFESFKKLIDKIPKEVKIDFSGMAEPFAAKDCGKMIEYVLEKGHRVAVFTTLVGATPEDIDVLKKINFTLNNKLVVHLPDKEKNFKAKINDNYKKTLKKLMETDSIISKLSTGEVEFMTMSRVGEVDPEISDLFPFKLKSFVAISRAGNLFNENEKYETLTKLKIRKTGSIFCGPAPLMNHTVLLPNGDVLLCCMDYSMDHILINLHNETYESIFTSKEFLRVLDSQLNDNLTDDIICRNCESATEDKNGI